MLSVHKKEISSKKPVKKTKDEVTTTKMTKKTTIIPTAAFSNPTAPMPKKKKKKSSTVANGGGKKDKNERKTQTDGGKAENITTRKTSASSSTGGGGSVKSSSKTSSTKKSLNTNKKITRKTSDDSIKPTTKSVKKGKITKTSTGIVPANTASTKPNSRKKKSDENDQTTKALKSDSQHQKQQDQQQQIIKTAVNGGQQKVSDKPLPHKPLTAETENEDELGELNTGVLKSLVKRPERKDSVTLYKQGYRPGQGLVVTKSSNDTYKRNPRDRPVFITPLNLNDSTASFLGNSRNISGPGYLEMSSGLVAHQHHNKYNFKISLDDTNEMSQTAHVLKNFIFDENDNWDSDRTEPTHVQKQSKPPQLNLPSFEDDGLSFDQRDASFIIPSTETTNRSFIDNMGRTSTRLSFLFNKNTGLLCKNCFSSTCSHMDKFNTLATPKLQKAFNSSDNNSRYDANSSDLISQTNDSVEDTKADTTNNNNTDTSESMRLIDVNNFYHTDKDSGEQIPFRELNMEYEMKFETSTPNEDTHKTILPPELNGTNTLNLSGSALRYTPGIMNSNQQQQQHRPLTSESLKYDSDYDDDSYLKDCKNSTFETLDLNSGVFFSNTEPLGEADGTPPLNTSSPSTTVERNNAPVENKKAKATRRISLSVMPELPTVFEERSAPNSALVYPGAELYVLNKELDDRQDTSRSRNTELQDLLDTVTDNLANMLDDDPDLYNNSENQAEMEEFAGIPAEKETLRSQEQQTNTNKDPHEDTSNPSNNNYLRDSLDEGDMIDDQNPDGAIWKEKELVNENHQPDCVTPLEEQGVFKRIKDENEEKYIEQLNEDELQAWLQANRKHTFEKDYFNGNMDNASDLNCDTLPPEDKEVLQINTPEWAEINRQAAQPEKKQNMENQQRYPKHPNQHQEQHNQQGNSTTTDQATQADIPSPPLYNGTANTATPQTGSSMDLPKTQGSYRQIDLLVLDRSRDNRVVQENQIFEAEVEDVHLDARDVDSGVHSVNTNRSDATILNEDQLEGDGGRNENVYHHHIPENLLINSTPFEEQMHNPAPPPIINQVSPLFSNQPSSLEQNQPPPPPPPPSVPNRDPVMLDQERITLPIIENPYENRIINDNNNEMFYETSHSNRLVIQHSLPPHYFDERDMLGAPQPRHRDIMSPMLEHHLKMAQYHRERVALLTPLFEASYHDHGIVNRPRPPIARAQPNKNNFKRRYSATGSSSYETLSRQPGYLDSLNNISPRSRPFVPHPPSYERRKQLIGQRLDHHDDMTQSSKWQRKNRWSFYSDSWLGKGRKVDTKHDTSLYLTAPYRSSSSYYRRDYDGPNSYGVNPNSIY